MPPSLFPGVSRLGAFDGSPTTEFVKSVLRERNFRFNVPSVPPNAFKQLVIVLGNDSITGFAQVAPSGSNLAAGVGAPNGYVSRDGAYEPAGISQQDDGSLFQIAGGTLTYYGRISHGIGYSLGGRSYSPVGGWFSPHVMQVRKLLTSVREPAQGTFGDTPVEFWHTESFGGGGHEFVVPQNLPPVDLRVQGVAGDTWSNEFPDQMTFDSPYPYLGGDDIFSGSYHPTKLTYKRLSGTPPSITSLILRFKNAASINGSIEAVRAKRLSEPERDWRLHVAIVYTGPFRIAGDDEFDTLSKQHFAEWVAALRGLFADDPAWPLIVTVINPSVLSDPILGGDSFYLFPSGFWLSHVWYAVAWLSTDPD